MADEADGGSASGPAQDEFAASIDALMSRVAAAARADEHRTRQDDPPPKVDLAVDADGRTAEQARREAEVVRAFEAARRADMAKAAQAEREARQAKADEAARAAKAAEAARPTPPPHTAPAAVQPAAAPVTAAPPTPAPPTPAPSVPPPFPPEPPAPVPTAGADKPVFRAPLPAEAAPQRPAQAAASWRRWMAVPVAAVVVGATFWWWPVPLQQAPDPLDTLEAPSAGLPALPAPVPQPALAAEPPAPAALPPPLDVQADADASTDQRMAAELGRVLAAEGVAPGASPLAIVRYDALQIAPAGWRVIAPLHLQPVLALVRADSPLRSLQGLRGQRINTGLLDGGRGQSSLVLYRRLFGDELPLSAVTSLGRDEAIAALRQGKLDVVLVMDGLPSSWLDALPADTLSGLRLLPLDAGSEAGRRALKAYLPTQASLPGGAASVPALGVMSFLVATDPASEPETLARVARGLCAGLPRLQQQGHAAWRQVQAGLDLPAPRATPAAARAAWRACSGGPDNSAGVAGRPGVPPAAPGARHGPGKAPASPSTGARS